MARGRIASRGFACSQAVVDMPPVIRRNLARINAGRLYGINEAEYLRNLRPAMNMEQQLTAGIDL
tara:strand:+ start:690 stop:884 length:195 start_codon:yes stop_codon:yes gene_type:complete